jgi:hypothetical protein
MAIADAGLHVINEIYALIDAGAPGDAFVLGQAAYQVVPSNAPPAWPMWLTFLLGRAALLRGEMISGAPSKR